jgi:hypothetical protein
MARRQIARTLGAAAGGLLGVAFFPGAMAFADGLDLAAVDALDPSSYQIDPVAPETITGFYNMTTAPPGVNESVQGYGQFNVLDSHNDPLGSFDAYESTAPYLANANDAIVSSQVLYVDSGIQSLLPDGTDPVTNYLPDGSVISITHSGGGTLENIYSAIPGTGSSDTVTDILKTPYGNFDLSSLVGSLFNAGNVTPALPDGFSSTADPTILAVNGLPPLTIALQGIQTLEFDGANPFTALETTTTDGIGFHTEAFLVTDNDNNPDALPVGSVYNTIDFHNLQNVYSSVPQPDGTDKITDTLINTTTHQTTDLSSLFAGDDASAGLTDGSNLQPISFGGTTISVDPDTPETFTGINGLPPGNASIQGTDLFHFLDGTDSTTFHADVTTIPDMAYSNYSEALLVTSSADPSLVPEGSIFDLTTYGSGFENIYTDLPGLGADGHNLITDTFVTPFGDFDLSWLYQSIDASAGLNPSDGLVSFMDAAWLDLIHLF